MTSQKKLILRILYLVLLLTTLSQSHANAQGTFPQKIKKIQKLDILRGGSALENHKRSSLWMKPFEGWPSTREIDKREVLRRIELLQRTFKNIEWVRSKKNKRVKSNSSKISFITGRGINLSTSVIEEQESYSIDGAGHTPLSMSTIQNNFQSDKVFPNNTGRDRLPLIYSVSKDLKTWKTQKIFFGEVHSINCRKTPYVKISTLIGPFIDGVGVVYKIDCQKRYIFRWDSSGRVWELRKINSVQ